MKDGETKREVSYDCDGNVVNYDHPSCTEPKAESELDLKWSFPEGRMTIGEMIERRTPGLLRLLRGQHLLPSSENSRGREVT